MSARYRDLLNLAETTYQAGQEQQAAGNDHRAAMSFDSAARFLHSALQQLDPDAPELHAQEGNQ